MAARMATTATVIMTSISVNPGTASLARRGVFIVSPFLVDGMLGRSSALGKRSRLTGPQRERTETGLQLVQRCNDIGIFSHTKAARGAVRRCPVAAGHRRSGLTGR